jgi:hypothetical protein
MQSEAAERCNDCCNYYYFEEYEIHCKSEKHQLCIQDYVEAICPECDGKYNLNDAFGIH